MAEEVSDVYMKGVVVKLAKVMTLSSTNGSGTIDVSFM